MNGYDLIIDMTGPWASKGPLTGMVDFLNVFFAGRHLIPFLPMHRIAGPLKQVSRQFIRSDIFYLLSFSALKEKDAPPHILFLVYKIFSRSEY